ncbi:MAG: type IV secretory system conjugative DNA transfer family protein [Acidimicrobiales bacterium]
MGPVVFMCAVAVLLTGWLATRPPARPSAGHGSDRDDVARWARRRDLRPLAVSAPVPGRLVLGTAHGRLLATDPGHSLLVVGPTQSFKTTGLAVPALLEWRGPVVASSVKGDLARATVEWRRGQGRVWVYDPTGSTDLGTAGWSPLAEVTGWPAARRMAAALVEAGRTSTGSFTDGDFWYANAAKLLAPLLLAAARSGRTMADVVRWIDEQETDEVAAALESGGEWSALQSLRATWGRDDRQRSAVYTTAETVVEVFAEPTVAASAMPGPGAVDPVGLLEGNNSLYLCAPAHEQRRLRPLFSGLVTRVIEAAYDRAARGGPLDPPLLVVLDEAANVAPVAELDVLASTAAGHGIQLVTIWQDLAQLTARYGPRSGTVINNHRAKLFLSGIADPATLDQASALIGESERRTASTTVDGGRTSGSTTVSTTFRPLAPADALRRMAPGTGVLISGSLPPARLALRPWYRDRDLRRRSESRPAKAW